MIQHYSVYYLQMFQVAPTHLNLLAFHTIDITTTKTPIQFYSSIKQHFLVSNVMELRSLINDSPEFCVGRVVLHLFGHSYFK